MPQKIIGWFVIVGVLVGVFWLGKCSDEGKGRDDEQNRVADSVRTAVIDSFVPLMERDSTRLAFEAAANDRLARELDAAARTEENLRATIGRIRRPTGGGGVIAVPAGEDSTIPVPALALIDSLAAANLVLRGIVDRQGALIDTLEVHNADLREGIDRAHFALIESEKEVNRLKSRKAGGWRDRLRPKCLVEYAAIYDRGEIYERVTTETGTPSFKRARPVRHGGGIGCGWQVYP